MNRIGLPPIIQTTFNIRNRLGILHHSPFENTPRIGVGGDHGDGFEGLVLYVCIVFSEAAEEVG